MERVVIIVNGWKPLTIITKHSILDVAEPLDSPLHIFRKMVGGSQSFNKVPDLMPKDPILEILR